MATVDRHGPRLTGRHSPMARCTALSGGHIQDQPSFSGGSLCPGRNLGRRGSPQWQKTVTCWIKVISTPATGSRATGRRSRALLSRLGPAKTEISAEDQSDQAQEKTQIPPDFGNRTGTSPVTLEAGGPAPGCRIGVSNKGGISTVLLKEGPEFTTIYYSGRMESGVP